MAGITEKGVKGIKVFFLHKGERLYYNTELVQRDDICKGLVGKKIENGNRGAVQGMRGSGSPLARG